MSDSLSIKKGKYGINKGSPLPSDSNTAKFNKNYDNVSNAEDVPDVVEG
jgi:hypothetical protein